MMAYWEQYAGPPEMLELQDYRINSRGGSPPARRIYAPKEPPFRWDERPLRIERPWRDEAEAKDERPMTPAEVMARVDAWCARDRRPLVPDRPAKARRGRSRRRGGCAETGLSFGTAWWS